MAFLLDQLENDLLACLCDMLTDEGRPPCACHHYAGDDVPPSDRCGVEGDGNGMAWLRRDTSILPRIPVDRVTWDGGVCGASTVWETVIELGIRRCIQAVQRDSVAPDPDLYNQDRELINADRQTLYQVLCCDAWSGDGVGFSVVQASLVPEGPLGACSGNVLRVTVSGDPMATDDQDGDAEVVFVSGPVGA